MRLARRIAEWLSGTLAVLSGCCLVGVVVVTMLNVIFRKPPFNTPVPGAHELAAFFGAMVIALALPSNQLRGGNIKVELLQSFLPMGVRRALDRVVNALCSGLCALIAWRLVAYAATLHERGEVSLTLAIPFFPFIVIVGICFLILALVLAVQAVFPVEDDTRGGGLV